MIRCSVAPGAGFTLAQANGAFHPRFPRFDDYSSELERVGATGSIQWKPTDRTQVSVDVLYAQFKGQREERYLERRFGADYRDYRESVRRWL